MTAVCFNCGQFKEAPFQACPSCRQRPGTDNDIAVSLLMTDQNMPPEDLQATAQSIRAGERMVLPDELRTSVLARLAQARRPPPPARRRSPAFWTWTIGAIGALVVFLIFHPWPHYQLASVLNTVPAYESFLNRHDGTDLADKARNEIRLLQEDDVWETAAAANQLPALRNYERIYYNGKYLGQARAKIRELADVEWQQVAQSRSESEIWDFINKYPESTKRADAQKRIMQLHDDWEWVKAADKLEHYKAFAGKFPNHPEAAWLEKKIIDLEVKAIAAGEFGEMPKAQATSLGGSVVNLEVENGTGYVLTVLYSGEDSKRLVVPVGEKGIATLKPGNYQVAASVSAADVSHYYGSDSMQGGEYSSRFYIETSYGGSRSPILPGYLPTRRR